MFLSKRFAMEPREFRKALWLGAALMAVTASYTIVKTARDSLFLSTLPAASLPWVYIAVGVATLATSTGVELLTRPLSPLRSLVATMLCAAVGLTTFALGLSYPSVVGAGWLHVYVNAYGVIVVSQFWVYANSSSDPREMKRICGIVGGGAILGGLLAGVVASALADRRGDGQGSCASAPPSDRTCDRAGTAAVHRDRQHPTDSRRERKSRVRRRRRRCRNGAPGGGWRERRRKTRAHLINEFAPSARCRVTRR